MKQIKYLFAIVFTAAFTVFGQSVEFKSGNFKDKKEEFNKAKAAFEKGDEFYKKGNESFFDTKSSGLNYQLALKNYTIAQDFNPNNAELNFKIGVCYINGTDMSRGLPYIKTALKLDPKCDPFLQFYVGRMHQLNEKYDDAIKAYSTFENEYKKADNFAKFSSNHKRECAFAKTATAKPERVWVDNFKVTNTESDDMAPAISTDGSEMVFSSTRANSHPANEAGGYDYEIYKISNNGTEWGAVKKIEGPINTNQNDVANNLSFDGTKMLLHRENGGQTDIYESKLSGNDWSSPTPMHININLIKSSEMYAAYNHDGYKIYFTRFNEVSTAGGELFFSSIASKMLMDYKIATSIPILNSKFDDGPIYISVDGEIMYFASKGHAGLGGYDIYYSKKSGSTWSAPVNMGYPINTPYDDFFFAPTANGKYAYITSNRAGGSGGYDIYKATFWGPEKKPITSVEEYLLSSNAQPMKDQTIEASVSINKVSLTVFKGITIDALTRKPVEATIEITDNGTGKIIESFVTNSSTGKFLITLIAGKNYGIAVKATNYLFHSENFDIALGSEYNLVNKTIELKNIAIGSKIALRNVFFDVAKSTLRTESNAELERLVKLMKDVPKLKVEISGHTDNTGAATANDLLSQQRADAVVNYLIGKGVAKDRLISKGYGSIRPVSGNDTDSGRQNNRRTEFEIKGNS